MRDRNQSTEQPATRTLGRELIEAVARLDPAPRKWIWRSLSYCVVDAVWSIGANYSTVVAPLVHRIAACNQDPDPLVDATRPLPDDPLPLETLLEWYPSARSLCEVANLQRTSPRGGILKAEAALRYAEILVERDAGNLAQAKVLFDDASRAADLDVALKRVPGDGSYGVRRSYLVMLCGSDDVIKPDRMVLRWLKDNGLDLNPDDARAVLGRLAAEVTIQLGRPVTPWMADHAIWLATRPAHQNLTTVGGALASTCRSCGFASVRADEIKS